MYRYTATKHRWQKINLFVTQLLTSYHENNAQVVYIFSFLKLFLLDCNAFVSPECDLLLKSLRRNIITGST